MWRFLKKLSLLTPSLTAAVWSANTFNSEDLQEIETTIHKVLLTSEHSEFSKLKIYAFDAQILGREVTSHLDISLGRHISAPFNDGERHIRLLESVRGHKVFIIKSFENQNINDGIMELMFAVACIKNEGASRVTAIIPYLPYSSPTQGGEHIYEGRDFFTCFAADIVKMLEAMGCDEIVTLNSLISYPKGFANESCFTNIEAPEIAIPYLFHNMLTDPVLIGSRLTLDASHITKLQKTFSLFDCDCKVGLFDGLDYFGEGVVGKDVILFSNLIRTGKTFAEQARSLKAMGAKRIYCYSFHALCTNDEFEEMVNTLPIEEFIITNTVTFPIENKKIRTISVSKLLGEIISILSENKSLADYRGEREMLNYAYLQKIKEINHQKRFNQKEAREV